MTLAEGVTDWPAAREPIVRVLPVVFASVSVTCEVVMASDAATAPTVRVAAEPLVRVIWLAPALMALMNQLPAAVSAVLETACPTARPAGKAAKVRIGAVVVPVLTPEVGVVGLVAAIELMNQPCEAGREAWTTGWPTTNPEDTVGTSASVKVGAAAVPPLAAANVKADVEPMTVPSERFCAGELAAMFWLIRNWVGLRILVITVPSGTPRPLTTWPTTRVAVEPVVIVVVAFVPVALIASAVLAVPMRPALIPGLEITQVPSPILRIPAPAVVLVKIPCSSFAAVLAPPSTKYLAAAPVLATLRASTKGPEPLASTTPLDWFTATILSAQVCPAPT